MPVVERIWVSMEAHRAVLEKVGMDLTEHPIVRQRSDNAMSERLTELPRYHWFTCTTLAGGKPLKYVLLAAE